MRSPPLRCEELFPREVWSATPAGGVVISELSLSLPSAAADWRSVAFVTPDGVGHPTDLSVAAGQVTGRWDTPYTFSNSATLTVVVGDALGPLTRYQQIPVYLAANAFDETTSADPPAPTRITTTTTLPVDGTSLTLWITANKPVWSSAGVARVDVTYGPSPPPPPPPPATQGPSDPSPTTPPVLIPPPPPPAATGPAVPPPVGPPAVVLPAGPAALPPVVAGPPVASVSPPVAPPPRPPDRASSTILFANAQLDHQAGTFAPWGASSRASDAEGRRFGSFDAATAAADHAPAGSWSTSYTFFSSPFAAGAELRERVRATLDPQAGEAHATSGDRRLGPSPRPTRVLRDEGLVAAKPVRWTEGMLVETPPDAAEAVLVRLAARPLPEVVAATEVEAAGPKRKHAHLVSVLAAVVTGGVCFRWYRLRSDEVARSNPVGMARPPVV